MTVDTGIDEQGTGQVPEGEPAPAPQPDAGTGAVAPPVETTPAATPQQTPEGKSYQEAEVASIVRDLLTDAEVAKQYREAFGITQPGDSDGDDEEEAPRTKAELDAYVDQRNMAFNNMKSEYDSIQQEFLTEHPEYGANPAHERMILNELRAMRLRDGRIVNFWDAPLTPSKVRATREALNRAHTQVQENVEAVRKGTAPKPDLSAMPVGQGTSTTPESKPMDKDFRTLTERLKREIGV